MALSNPEDPLSDEEVFFGKLTLKELKKHILWDQQREPWSISAANSPTIKNDPNKSLRIIQTQSQPNLISDRGSYPLDSPGPNSPYWFEKTSDDSFDKMENMVEKLCDSPKYPVKSEELNNTLEVIEYILNNPPIGTDNVKTEIKLETNRNEKSPEAFGVKAENSEIIKCQPQTPKTVQNINKKKDNVNLFKNAQMKTGLTPLKHNEGYATPTHIKYNPVFKTPAQPLSHKKPSATSLKKTPSKTNANYQHICSPVASYINNCPIVPLVKDVHPKKPLPGPSSIPKIVKSAGSTKARDNIILPSVAYKSAKKTKVIDIPDENKLPQSQWAKKLTSSLPKPMVMKHNHRELNLAKNILTQQYENSFANLSYHQAELSVCTQKSAFKSKNNV